MAAPRRNSEDEDAFVFVFDRRTSNTPELKIPTGGLFTFNDFKARVCSVSALIYMHAFFFHLKFSPPKQKDPKHHLKSKIDVGIKEFV